MQIKNILQHLEQSAPLSLQENYDNSGLLTGNPDWECKGVLCSLDATEDVIKEAIQRGCNLVVSHHPILFQGLKKITGSNYVEKTIIRAIKEDIAIYAIHTNLDNILTGVNNRIADKLGLLSRQILQPKPGQLMKLVTFVPQNHTETVKNALFEAGAGQIGNYSETSFQTTGSGNFKGNDEASPFVGETGKRHTESEHRLETIFPFYLKEGVTKALKAAHPYEEVAYDIISLSNDNQSVGSGLMGILPEPLEETGFLHMLKTSFGLSLIRHTPLLGKKIQKVAICGGSGSFLTGAAIRAGADIYITADLKYHEFFDANGKILLADIGHWESEQFTTELLIELLQAKFPTFAVLKSEVKTNPVNYFLG